MQLEQGIIHLASRAYPTPPLVPEFLNLGSQMTEEGLAIAKSVAWCTKTVLFNQMRTGQQVVVEFQRFDHDMPSLTSFDEYHIVLREMLCGLRMPFTGETIARYVTSHPAVIIVYRNDVATALKSAQDVLGWMPSVEIKNLSH